MAFARGAAWEYGELSARGYELDKPVGKSLHGDVEFFTRRLGGVDGDILEPAVGTGRMLVPLLQQGLRVTGYDTSEYMLRICRDNLAAAGLAAEVFIGDMETYRKPEAFEAILLPTGSIVLLPDQASTLTALRNVHDSLQKGGRAFIDLPPSRHFTDPGPLRHWWDGETDLLTAQVMHIDTDQVRQRVIRWVRYELWRNGKLVDTQLHTSGLLWFGVQEFQQLLHRAGFNDVRVYSDYVEDAEPADNAGIWTFEAVRTE